VSTTEHVVWRLGGSRYALPADVVARLVAPMPLSRVPAVPSWVAGLGDLRGRVVPVLDLRPLLGAPQAPWPSSARVLACSFPDGSARVDVGLLADEVVGMLGLTDDEIYSLPSAFGERPDGLLRGLVDVSPPVAVLDPAGVLALRTRLGPG
jgi:purine-binding chemotaxis protein CheW